MNDCRETHVYNFVHPQNSSKILCIIKSEKGIIVFLSFQESHLQVERYLSNYSIKKNTTKFDFLCRTKLSLRKWNRRHPKLIILVKVRKIFLQEE